jgi:hypothetical protein
VACRKIGVLSEGFHKSILKQIVNETGKTNKSGGPIESCDYILKPLKENPIFGEPVDLFVLFLWTAGVFGLHVWRDSIQPEGAR